MNRGVCAALLLVAGFFIAGVIGNAPVDGDLWWQRQLGEVVLRSHALPTTLGAATFSAPNAPWVPHEWVFSTLWALADRNGAALVFGLGCAGLAIVTLVVEALRSEQAPPRARIIMLVLVASALLPSFGVRAQVLGWPLLALLLLVLESGGRRAWFAVPIAVVWYNLHASALVVPCIVLVHGIGAALDRRQAASLSQPFALAGACAVAALATPFGIALPRFIIAWSANPATDLIYEWLPAAPDKILILAGVWLIAALLVAGEMRGARLTWSQRLLAVGLFAATLLHIRNLALFGIVAGPWTANALASLLPRVTAPREPSVWADRCFAAAALILVLLRVHGPAEPGPVAPAVAGVTALRQPLRVACEDFSWCSRFAGERRIQVLLDGRTDAYPPGVFADYRRLLRGDALPVVQRWNIDAVLVKAHGPLAGTLRAHGWRYLGGDDPQVYRRPGALAVR